MAPPSGLCGAFEVQTITRAHLVIIKVHNNQSHTYYANYTLLIQKIVGFVFRGWGYSNSIYEV